MTASSYISTLFTFSDPSVYLGIKDLTPSGGSLRVLIVTFLPDNSTEPLLTVNAGSPKLNVSILYSSSA